VTAPDRRRLRAGDADRQAAADRLRHALADGRLDLLEYDDRLGRAYRAGTQDELDELVADLPAGPTAPGPVPAPGRRLPVVLRVLWTIWLAVLTVDLTVWVLVSLGNGAPEYFWPMWLLVPGTVLLAVTLSVRAARAAGRRQRED
jgi:hypothetical protein